MNEIYVIIFVFLHVISESTSEDVLGCGGFVKSHVAIDISKVEVKLLTKQGILKDKMNCAPNNGYYFFPLYDKGEYVLELEPPPGWSFGPSKVNLTVDGVNDLCSQGKDINFVFKGFRITGKVQSVENQGGPEGVELELKSNAGAKKALTTSGGSFFFDAVLPGKYTVKISNSKWKVVKNSINIVVDEANVEIPQKSLMVEGYNIAPSTKNQGEAAKDTTIGSSAQSNSQAQVNGRDKPMVPTPQIKEKPIVTFSVEGRVLKTPKGAPIANALVFVSDKQKVRTDPNGIYKLDKMKAGTYNLRIEADGFQFKETQLKIGPNSKLLPDITPTAFKVCGLVVSEKLQTVTFSQIGSTRIVTTSSDPASGKFCEYLSPGKYQVQVVVNNADAAKGLQFFPKVENIEVTSGQANKIVFSQLKATLEGKVQCIQKKDCDEIKVILRPLADTSGKNDIYIDVIDNAYKVSDIYPGNYEVSLAENKLCWKSSKQVLNVNSVNIEVPTFVQSGYAVTFISSHDTQVLYKIPGQNTNKNLQINKGRNVHCLEKTGSYKFQINSCHSYEENVVNYNTDTPSNEIFLNAQKHTITFFIESDKKHGDVSATVNIDGVKTPTGPLPFSRTGYEIKLLLNPSESAVIIPQSDILYFNPPILSISGSNDCENLGSKFKAVLGVVFKGKIIPPLSGVLVTVESENSDALMAETDINGVYKFPPLDTSKKYTIAAKKESYVLIGPNDKGDFHAHKLAEIAIEVFDKTDKSPLQGTLLSLSGGESYRRNLLTNENGKIAFNSLSPGEYFLRPMMKEYSFEPNSKIIKVNEGETVSVQLLGKKVAYSAYGQVTSLNREPEENIMVVAQGLGNCSHFAEDSTSEANGNFRIRGLQPYCSYDVTVKNSGSEKHPVERSAPKTIHVEKVTEDIHGLKLIVFRPMTNVDLLIKVYAKNPEHYKSLRLKVIREGASSTIVYSGRVDTSSNVLTPEYNKGVLVQIPPIAIDGKTYSVHLESNLNNKLEPEPEIFVANSSFKYVEMDFIVKSNVTEQDIKQTSIWTLVFIFSIMLAVYNIDKISQFLKEKLGSYVTDIISMTSRKSNVSEYAVDNNDIDQIVQSINAVKRKPKSKKI